MLESAAYLIHKCADGGCVPIIHISQVTDFNTVRDWAQTRRCRLAPWPSELRNCTSFSLWAVLGWSRFLKWEKLWVHWDVCNTFQTMKSNMKDESDNKRPQSKGSLVGGGSARGVFIPSPDFAEAAPLVFLGTLPTLERASGHMSISLSPVLESVSLTL